MLRRKFVTLLGGAMMLPAAARAQQQPLIGLLGTANPRAWAAPLAAFHQGLSEAGYAEGRNVTVDYRWADGQYERLPEMANDLVRRNVSLLVGFTTPAALAAKAATATIPIVFTTISDPVQVGLVASFNRPGGNITGASYQNLEVGPKLLELMREVLPAATAMALLINPTNPNAESQASNMQAVARTLGLELHVLRAGNERELDAAFAALKQLKAGATALRQALPAVYAGRTFAAAGGLMSYAGSAAEAYKQAGSYAGRILKGTKPADLPVQQTTKVELIINMKTARALGINIPLPLLGRADEVIE
jgi:putative ABC transport system substrate-binding protein